MKRNGFNSWKFVVFTKVTPKKMRTTMQRPTARLFEPFKSVRFSSDCEKMRKMRTKVMRNSKPKPCSGVKLAWTPITPQPPFAVSGKRAWKKYENVAEISINTLLRWKHTVCACPLAYLEKSDGNNSGNTLSHDVQAWLDQFDFPCDQKGNCHGWIHMTSTYVTECLQYRILR